MKLLVKTLTFIALISTLVFFTGCASIVSGSRQKISFKSNPEGALVKFNGEVIGNTPITTNLSRKLQGPIVSFEKAGYKKETFQLKNGINGWYWGNIIIGGYFGSTTDSMTGAVNSYSPDKFDVTLTPIDPNQATGPAETRAYVMANYKYLFDELNTKRGPYLSGLFTLMKVGPEKQAEYTQTIKKLADANSDIAEFADKVAALTPQ